MYVDAIFFPELNRHPIYLLGQVTSCHQIIITPVILGEKFYPQN